MGRPTELADDSPPTLETSHRDLPTWSVPSRLGFRFLFSYVALYLLPLDPLWRITSPLVAERIFGLAAPLSFAQNGSGDTTTAYVQAFTVLVCAIAAAGIWSLADRRSPAYPRLARWLTTATRYFVGMTMLSYGLAKAIPTQFPEPTLDQLMRTYAESSPMSIVWTLMGVSPAYTIFSGLAETTGGVLLLFRRTTTLGAAVLVAVLANVVMLNFAYDIPVKLFSSHLLAMAIGLLLVDGRRLIAVFWTNAPVPPAVRRPLFDSTSANRIGRAVALLVVCVMAVTNARANWQVYNTFGNGRPHPELRGAYDVSRFVYDGEELPPLLTDAVRWRTLIVDRALVPAGASLPGGGAARGQIVIQRMNGQRAYYAVTLDEAGRTMNIGAGGAGGANLPVGDLAYERSGASLIITGTWQDRPIEVDLRLRPPDDFLLINRGFHWINEFPFNR